MFFLRIVGIGTVHHKGVICTIEHISIITQTFRILKASFDDVTERSSDALNLGEYSMSSIFVNKPDNLF